MAKKKNLGNCGYAGCNNSPGEEYIATGYCGKHQYVIQQKADAEDIRLELLAIKQNFDRDHKEFCDQFPMDEEETQMMNDALGSGLISRQELHEGVAEFNTVGYKPKTYLELRQSMSHSDALTYKEVCQLVGLSNDEIVELGEGNTSLGAEKVGWLVDSLNRQQINPTVIDFNPSIAEKLQDYDFDSPAPKDAATFIKDNRQMCESKLKEMGKNLTVKDLVTSPQLWKRLTADPDIKNKFASHIAQSND